MLNEAFAWVWICLGIVSGAWIGLGFKNEDHMGGYAGWRRRMLRLGHIAFFGTAILNILFVQAAFRGGLSPVWIRIASWSFIAGAALMPAVCFLSAFWKRASVLFVLPVVALSAGSVIVATGLVYVQIYGRTV